MIELTLEFKRPSVIIQTSIACFSNRLSVGKKAIVIAPGRKQKTPKQMTTMKQDFARPTFCQNTFIFVVLSTAAGSCGRLGVRDNFLTTNHILV